MKSDRDELALDNLRKSLKIDKDALDDELVEQPTLFLLAADAASLAMSRRDEAKAELDQTYAVVCDTIRTEAVAKNEKMTEAKLEAQAKQNKDFVEATDKWLRLKKKSDDASNLKESYDQRGKAMKELVALFIGGYWQVSGASGSKRRFDNDEAARGRRAYEASKK